MNFDNAKENIQPLACGRDAKRLEIAINAELNDEDAQKELQHQKCEYEEKIQNYCGDDPLEVWFDYISWVEQSFPKRGKECSIDELLKKCLLQFGNTSKYFQDSRFIKIYMKFIDTQENPIEIYQQLYNHGIGTMIADFYIGWAYYYDLLDNFNKANDIFIKGIDARAQPLDELEQAQKVFSLSIPARLLSRDEEDKRKFILSMEEKRQALTSLRAHKQKHVGSLRTGNIIKSLKPGKIPSSSSASSHSSKNTDNRGVNVFKDTLKKSNESNLADLSSQPDTLITHSLIDKARHKENKKEPGPWTKSNKAQKQNVINATSGSLAFSIMEDSENKTNDKIGEEFAIRLDPNFKRCNLPQTEYNVPLFISEGRPFNLPKYDKIMIYPGNGEEYSIEELRAWKYFKKLNVQNRFVIKYDKFWTNEGLNLKTRFAPCFANTNQKQTELLTEPSPNEFPNNQHIHVFGWKNYNYSDDLTAEDYMAEKWRALHLKNKTVVLNISLDETGICLSDNSVCMIDETNLSFKKNDDCMEALTPAVKKMRLSLDPQSSASSGVRHDNKPPFFSKNVESRSNIKEHFGIGQNLALADKQLPIYNSNEPTKDESNFKIFEDDKVAQFKEPQYTGTIKKSMAKPQIEVKENEAVGFSPEDTFSTQNFVLFIKQEETSTPLKNKGCKSIIPTSQENVKPVKIPQQLSILGETSESNMGGTCGNETNTKLTKQKHESSINFNQTGKSETSYPRESSIKDTTKQTTLGLSALKITDDSVAYPKNSIRKEVVSGKTEELLELFSKTSDKNVKNSARLDTSSALKSFPISINSKLHDNSDDELLNFFKKSPKTHKEPFINHVAPMLLNKSVTIPNIKDMLLTKNCDNIPPKTNETISTLGASMVIPKNQSIMPEFTENISIFAQHQKSKLVSFTTTKLNEENSDFIKFSKISVSDRFTEGDFGKSGQASKNEFTDYKDNLNDEPVIALAKQPKIEAASDSKFKFEIFTDENSADAIQDVSMTDLEAPAKNGSNFEIFEDNKVVQFKDSQYAETNKYRNDNSQPIQATKFSSEETFSTQNFVLFIKQQETSTPLKQKEYRTAIPDSTENDMVQKTIKLPVKLMASEILSLSPECDVIPKQLSVILETSETNTGGTSSNGTNTKSSEDENDSSKFLASCNHTVKSKTLNNGQNLSTIHENSMPTINSSTSITLGIQYLKPINNPIDEVDDLCELFSKTPDKNVKSSAHYYASSSKPVHISPKSKIMADTSDDELLGFFKKSPKTHKQLFNKPSSPLVLNDSVTIPTITTTLGTSMAMPKNQSIMPEFTENISIFAQHQTSKLTSCTTTTTKLSEDNSDLMGFSTKISESNRFTVDGDIGKSIYEPKDVIINDDDNFDDEELEMDNSFQHKMIDLNQTKQQIDNYVTAESIDPWNVELCGAFLEDLDFFNHIEKLDGCVLINNVPSIKGRSELKIADRHFNSIQYISRGAYGFIYKARDASSNKMVALKQERPPNCWEYYISLIITERIIIEFLPRFMVIENALIGNNSSIFVSDYVQYGTLLDVCNKNYTSTSQHLNELIVMLLAIELFTIVDLLHSADIIHGDIKPDNFMLMTPLSLDSNRPMLKLIDYGNSIDMQLFAPNTTFKTATKTEGLICSEMQEGRPWTYQTDLYCLAGTIHVLLFGHYMETQNKFGKINISTKLPRYFHKAVWDPIFTSLLNVLDCRNFPNIQDFKLDLKEILADKEKLVLDQILNFNRTIL